MDCIILKDLGMKFPKKDSKQKKRYALVKCPKCDLEFEQTYNNIKTRKKTICRECSFAWGHGQYKTKLYTSWQAMKMRCYSKKNKFYNNYGGKGIYVCNDWKNSFESFMGWANKNGYEEGLTTDRIDNNGNYEPCNCRWANSFIQNSNNRLLRSTNTSGYRGVHYYKPRDKYVVHIQYKNKTKFLGYHKDIEEAAKAYDRHVIENNLPHPTNILKKD